jgi:putative transposase
MKTQYDPRIHHRRSIRLKGYDYSSAGIYFVTIVTHGRESIFGEIVGGEMRLNRCGEIVREEWERTPVLRPEVELGAYIIMPNHIHGILIFHSDGVYTVGTTRRVVPTVTLQSGSLGAIMAQFKSIVTKRIHALGGMDVPIWQNNYYEHIILNQPDLELTWLYIESNPAQWLADDENPAR